MDMEQPDTLPSETEPQSLVDAEDAPDGFIAVQVSPSTDDYCDSCALCNDDVACGWAMCMPHQRRDERTVIFKRKPVFETAPDSVVEHSKITNWVPSAWSGICDPHAPRAHEPFDEQTSESDIPGIRMDLAAAAFKQVAESLGADLSDAKPAPLGIAAVADMGHKARGWGA